MSNIEIIGLGALNIDHIYQVERILDDGEAVVKETTLSPGGSAANTIYGLGKLGVNTGFAGVVGDDAEGKTLVPDFEKVGVDTSHIRVKHQAKTGSVICLSDSLGKRSLYVLPGANSLLTIDDLDLDYINQAEMLHVSSFVDDRQFKVLLEVIGKLAPSVKVSFSPGSLYASKGLGTLSPILARTHVIFTNRDEIRQLTGRGYMAGSELCLNHGCGIVVVTLGKGVQTRGGIRMEVLGKPTQTRTGICYIRDAKTPHGYYAFASGPTVKSVVDTTGAGDAFATGFLYGLLNGKGLDECGRFGDIIAEFSITRMGARPGLPTLTELAQRYRELYNQEL